MWQLEWLKRGAAGSLLRMVGRARRNRARFYQGATGLRILTTHAMSARNRERFYRVVEWCVEHFDITEPSCVDAIVDERFQAGQRDKVLFTFDDGHERDFLVAEWLAERGIKATFFVIPSYIGRSVSEFMQFHSDHGVAAYNLAQSGDHDQTRGLSRTQIAEMVSMGHRIAAHNFAHRDMGKLYREADFEYEVGRALDTLSSLLGNRCQDFAWAFGHVNRLSEEATRYLQQHCRRVYAGIRGLNVGGISPAFLLRDSVFPEWPYSISKLYIEGGADDRWEADRAELRRRVGSLPEGR